MRIQFDAACYCNTGKIRKNNEDNFCFDGKCLDVVNNGLDKGIRINIPLKKKFSCAVFDGMGGENFGEIASFAAAHQMIGIPKVIGDVFLPEEKKLNKLSIQLNNAVLQAKKEQCTDRMGTTMVLLSFTRRYVFVCNIGDSRAYRLRDGGLFQISEDHIVIRPGREHKKAPLTQHLGIDPENMLIEPYIAKHTLRKGDMYLLCSDGLTDMLNDSEISNIMLNATCCDECADMLVQAALENGGRDNITVIVCRIH